jgi:hypothetical protein
MSGPQLEKKASTKHQGVDNRGEPEDPGSRARKTSRWSVDTLQRFTRDRRTRFLALLEAGHNVEQACAAVGVSRATVTRWAAKGRVLGARDDHSHFASRLDEIRHGGGDGPVGPLGVDDIVCLLERSAKRGSVPAMKLLLERHERGDREVDGEPDPFSDLDGDELGARRARSRRSRANAG